MNKRWLQLMSLFVIAVLVLAACGGGGTPAAEEPAAEEPAVEEPAAEEPAAEEPAAEEPAAEEPAEEPAAEGDVVEIRWFCCLGTGEDPAQIEAQNQVIEAFNASHPNINLVMEVVTYDAAYDALATQLASGNPPDIVGPVGVSGAEAFHGQWLDLAPLIDSTGYDTSQFGEGSVEFYNIEGEGQVGLPFAIFPSMLFYQRDLFDEAGLNYPPHAYGDPYVMPDGSEVEWNYDTLRELAMLLTVDTNGNDATSADFDPSAIVQYGYEPQYQDMRAVGSYFGAGSVVDEDGTTAQVPEPWQDGWRWLYDGVWNDHFIASAAIRDSEEFGAGNPFNSGKVAMALTHLWYTCCLGDAGGNWDVAAVPSHNGTTTANFNADTFRVLKDTEHPEEAFEVLSYLLGDASLNLLAVYGGLPARAADQDAFFANLNEQFPHDVDWQVATDGIAYADNPSFEGYMPNYQQSFDLIRTLLSKWTTEEGLDIDAEIEQFTSDLQGIFDTDSG